MIFITYIIKIIQFLKNLFNNFIIILKVFLNIPYRIVSLVLDILDPMLYKFIETVVFPIGHIIYDSFSDLVELCKLMMSEIIIPRIEYKREQKEARINYKDHRRLMKHEYFSKKYHIIEQYIHKVINLFSLIVTICSFIITFCICYIILWKWPHEYKPCKLPSGSLAGTKINGVILDVPPMKQPVYPTPNDESLLDFIIRWFKSIFIANYTHEKYTGGKVIVIPRAKYEAMMRKKKGQQNKDSRKKACLDDLTYTDIFDLPYFLVFYFLVNKFPFIYDYVIYFNINYLFTDVVNYIC